MKHLKEISFLLENLPGIDSRGEVTSWVNVKIDSDLPLRISRYVRALDTYVPSLNNNLLTIQGLGQKLGILSNPLKNNYGAQAQLSVMILLQYLKEIKSKHDASSAGFLFEDYIAGLLHGKKVGGFGNKDFEDGDGRGCQIKFYAEKGSTGTPTTLIKVRNEILDYYIIGLKRPNDALIWIIDDGGIFKIRDYIITKISKKGELTTYVDVKKLKESSMKPFILKFDNIDKQIDQIAEGLRKVVSELYERISDLHYNIETIITGVDKNQRVIDVKEMDEYYLKSESDMKDIASSLDKVKGKIITNLKRKKLL